MTRFAMICTPCASGVFLLFAAFSVFAAQKFPQTAQITEGEAIVYSSPGAERYETQTLKAGDKVEVYQINPDGWCAIRPPVGSFSWICGLYVDVGLDNIGVVTIDQLSSRIGSQFGETCKTVQVQLKKGERLILLERVETPANAASPVWYKITPPAGEFRWVRQESISTGSKLARRTANGDGIVQVSHEEPADSAFSGFEMTEEYNEHSGYAEQYGAFLELSESDPLEAPNLPNVNMPPANVRRTLQSQPGLQGGLPRSAGMTPAMIQPQQLQPQELQRQQLQPQQQSADPYRSALSQLNQEVHAALNRPTEEWMFDAMIQKGKTLIERAPTEYDRTRAMQMVQTLERTRNIRKTNAFRREQSSNFSGGKMTQSVLRGNAAPGTPATQSFPQTFPSLGMPTLPTATPATNLAASFASPAVSQANYSNTATSPNTSPFKATGRLGWFSQRPEGYPPYALVNEQGQIVSFVTPESGVDLKSHINKLVGINGRSGIYSNGNQRSPHIRASAVFPVQ